MARAQKTFEMIEEEDALCCGNCGGDHETEDCEEVDVCDLCGEDHETRDCQTTLCGHCFEILDNCDCDDPDEIDAAEWVEKGKPCPKN